MTSLYGDGTCFSVLLYQPLALGVRVSGDFHQLACDNAFVCFAQLPISVFHQGPLCPAITRLFTGGHAKGHRLRNIKELPDGVNGGELF